MQPGVILSDVSDHFPTFVNISTPVASQSDEYISVRDMKRFKLDDFLRDIKLKTEAIICELSNTKYAVNKAFSDIHDSILSVVNLHAPFKRVKRQIRKFKEKPWITRRLLSRGKDKDKLYVRALRTQNSDLYDNYKRVRNKLNHDIKLAEKRFIKKKLTLLKINQR